MKFEEHLMHHAVPEWRTKYINYKALKAILQTLSEQFPRPIVDLANSKRAALLSKWRQTQTVIEASSTELEFVATLKQTLDDIEAFYKERESIAWAKFEHLFHQLELYKHERGTTKANKKKDRRPTVAWISTFSAQNETEAPQHLAHNANVVHSRILTETSAWHCFHNPLKSARNRLRAAFEELYREIDMLKSFRNLNVTGFRKITKKHDKLTGLSLQHVFMREVDKAYFNTSTRLDPIVTDIENLYTNNLVRNEDRREAMCRLRVPEDRFEPMNYKTLRLGFSLGITFVSIIIVTVAAFISSADQYTALLQAFRIFRGMFIVALFAGGIALDCYLWRQFRINYVFIFGLNVRTAATHHDLFQLFGYLLVSWCVCVLIYTFSPEISTLPAETGPVVVVALFIFVLLNPFPVLMRTGRFWLLKVFGRICAAPFFFVKFEDFWLADQLVSLSTTFVDTYYLFCFIGTGLDTTEPFCTDPVYGIRPIITSLPLWFRILQCFRRYRDTRKANPHMLNAGKYTCNILVVVFSTLAAANKTALGLYNAYFVLWIVFGFISTVYSFVWDIKMDWGLWCKNVKHPFLRKKITYPPKFYYFAVINNLFCRLLWTLSLSIAFFNIFFPDAVTLFLAISECYRRVIWNLIRVENEHLNNVGEFRAVREIPLPFEFVPSDELQLDVDEEEKEGKTNAVKTNQVEPAPLDVVVEDNAVESWI